MDEPMNKEEATSILKERLGRLRKCSYAELKQMVESRAAKADEATGSSGNKYQIEIQTFWDDKAGANIRVQGSIDDGGWRAFLPLTSSSIMAPDGSYVDE